MEPCVHNAQDTGLELADLEGNVDFLARQLHTRDAATRIRGVQRLSHALAKGESHIFQELVNAAVELCGADSAGLSLEIEDGTDAEYYRWIATAGQYSGFLDAILPRYPSACGVCLERNRPQSFRVRPRFFEILGVEAPPVTDGLLLPWRSEGTRGTLFVMAHTRTEAFDQEDWHLMGLLADFTAMAMKQQEQQRALMRKTSAEAAAAMANALAHQINNPLQSLTNLVYLLTEADPSPHPREFRQELQDDLRRLNTLVRELLAVPTFADGKGSLAGTPTS